MKHIHISARKWAHTYGTNMSVAAYFDGERVLVNEGHRGCGESLAHQYVWEWLIEHGHPELDERYDNGAWKRGPLWRWCRENGITLTTEIVEVKRERDLHKK